MEINKGKFLPDSERRILVKCGLCNDEGTYY